VGFTVTTMTSKIPLLDAMLADPRRAEAPLGAGPARARTGFAVASFIAGLRCFDLDPNTTRARVEALAPGAQLFAWEGVGLAAEARGEIANALAAAPAFAPLLLVGAGWAAALRGVPITAPCIAHIDRWSVLDGHGFCLGLLDRRAALLEFARGKPGLAVEIAVDQGLGRSLYFVHGGTPTAIERAIAHAPAHRRAALWSGVGVASVITDGLAEPERAQLRALGGSDLQLGERLAGLLLARIGTQSHDSTASWIPDANEPPLALLRRSIQT
jgi:enediyne biosynthesis protein E3